MASGERRETGTELREKAEKEREKAERDGGDRERQREMWGGVGRGGKSE